MAADRAMQIEAPQTGPLVAWLGDDFTGAAAVMEVLSFAGLPAILFLSPEALSETLSEALSETTSEGHATSGYAGIGLATLARAQAPGWMQQNLPPLFQALDRTGASLVHYKICSTLDSAPEIGSIGTAIDIGRAQFGPAAVPVVTAAPPMRRYQAFGTLFCAAPDGVHRLDRHPVMAQHPVTPMGEADVARHLSAQTVTPVGCVDLEDLAQGRAASKLASAAQIWTVDLISSDQLAEVGALLWTRRGESRFVVGSQGVEYALVAHLQSIGALGAEPSPPGLGHQTRFAVVSGSVSPISAAQIAWARAHGFAAIRLDAAGLIAGESAAEDGAVAAAEEALGRGSAPLLFTAEGPDDPARAQVNAAAAGDLAGANDRLGRALGRILKRLTLAQKLPRIAVSGGDTSGRVCEELGIRALEAAAPTIPGAAICRARFSGPLDGLEIALKGGQMGSADYFGWVRDGGGARP